MLRPRYCPPPHTESSPMKSPRMRQLALAVCCVLPTLLPAMLPAAQAQEPVKVLRYIMEAAESGLDPATTVDEGGLMIEEAIFDTLYTYDYLARPVKVIPQAAAAMPEISADGKTYTIRLKKGIVFTPDPAFNGKRRTLTMADFVYSWKRLLDPRLSSPNSWLFEGKVVGLDEMAAAASKGGSFNYDKNIAGFELLDPYTLRIHLKQTDFNLPMLLAQPASAAVAHEVVAKYGDSKGEVASNPVGTGFYKLGVWERGSRIVLNENTDHLPQTWDVAPGDDPDDQRIVSQMKGKKMPQIGRIEISVQTEDQSRWLSFQSGAADLFRLGGALAPKALLNGKLRPELAAKGMQLSRLLDPEITAYYWNMQDPVVGGFSKEKIALRRAIAMAHDVDEEIRITLNGEAQRLEYPIPPGVVGHDPHYRSLLQYDPALANKLLDQFGYKIGKDGWRTLPDGKPMVIRFASRAGSGGELQAELWRKTYKSINIRMESQMLTFGDLVKEQKNCKLQAFASPWQADYPDGSNFMQLFYGPNIHQNNSGCYQDAQYDQWYAASEKLPAGPERDLLYHEMARRLEVNAGSMIAYGRYRNMLAQKTVLGYKKHPIMQEEWQYLDMATPSASAAK